MQFFAGHSLNSVMEFNHKEQLYSHLKYLKLHLFIFFQIFSFCVHVTSSSLGDTFSLICFKISFDILMYSLLYIQLIFFTFESSQALFD